jgi:hypothetical protein
LVVLKGFAIPGISSLCDAFHVPKPLSPQLLPFGKSDDDLGGVDLRGRAVFSSVREARTVRKGPADGPRGASSSRVLRVLARLCFRSVMALRFRWARFRTVRRSGRTVRGCLADGPCAPRGRSVIRSRLWRFCLLFRTVRGAGPDSPRRRAG